MLLGIKRMDNLMFFYLILAIIGLAFAIIIASDKGKKKKK